MTHVAEQGTDLDELEASVRVHLEDLAEQRSRLSLDVLSDPACAAELEAVEARLQDCQSELERVALARAERDRRGAEAAESAQRDRVAWALAEAARLGGVRAQLAVRVDAACTELAEAVSEFMRAGHEQAQRRREAGFLASAPSGSAVEGALSFALRQAGAGSVFGQLAAAGARPLSDAFSPPHETEKE